ncbi:3'5'-cyclic nucleotide phosphodiesterase family protein [Histomonas meleagridis]|uniref:3'5'-cyclic nucleotide phosphodiesterase family protein n=1 Tax=Histomonas meleagridis TaxID=135588 RepID=UPI0035595B9A|nr:3'5'-cyclic nucleotide phosphodiesterase family protein [Histomonas meleagridis]KAH0803873.1 3'5'-cyclic nucleotide phosphodiesterase family protein [Histomonas meleagridis]
MSGTPSMIFPILDNQNALYAIITLSRDFGSEPFNQNDQNFVTFFQHKFQIMSRYFLNQNIQEPILLDLLQLRTTQDQLPSFLKRISNLFDCKTCEVWTYDKGKKKINKYTEKQEDIQIGEGGIVEKVLESETIINIMNTKENPSYNSLHDGENGDPLIAIPVYREKHIFYAIVLRRPKNRPFFTRDDEETLKKMAPFIALSVHDSFQFSKIQLDFEKRTAEKEGLSALLEVAEIISGQLDAERLSEIIMEKGRYLTKADRCSLFLVSPKRDHLITSFHRGLKNCIDIPITKGIVGRTVTEGKALNISNAYEDESFDKETDLKNGYHTKSILSVPIFNQRGEVIGVTEMINKLDGNDFTTWDMNIIQIFNVFCGISLENARLYKDSVEMSNQLRLFFGISNAISKNEDIQKALTDILVHTRKALDSRRASIFLIDHENKLFQTYVIDGGKVPPTIPLSSGIIGVCAETKNSLFVNDPYNDKRFNREIDGQTGFKTTSLCVAPITCAKGEILGVVELVNKIHGSFKEKDMLFLQTIASFISVLIKNMKEINN